MLALVEVEPLYQEDGGEEWKPDPLESVAFPTISQLRTLQTVRWQQSSCSVIGREGCGKKSGRCGTECVVSRGVVIWSVCKEKLVDMC